MKEVIFATTNPAKIEQISVAVHLNNIKIHGLDDGVELPFIEEIGKTANENARIKAKKYAKALNKTVMSMDNALYFDSLEENQQPGLHVRRIHKDNERATDQELIEYYSKLIENLDENNTGYWEFGICIASPDGEIRETTVISPRVFVSKPSAKILEGYPLESLQIDPDTGRYLSELSLEEGKFFWQKHIGEKVAAFIESIDFTS